MKRALRTTLKCLLFGAATTAALSFAEGAKAEPRTHDGFYLQLATGIGYLSSSYSIDIPGIASTGSTLSGITTPFELLLGGTVGPVVIGGGLFTDYALSTSVSSDSGSTNFPDLSLYLLGVNAFADIYPDPHGGFHVRPFVGYAALSASYQGQVGGNSAGGPIFGAGVGYDFWVGDEWSIGVLGRFGYAPLKLEQASYNTMNPALLATFTFN